jgi:hypothetical protein
MTNHGVRFPPHPIGAEPAFPARGMLALFPHSFAGGGALPALAAFSGPVTPSQGGRWRRRTSPLSLADAVHRGGGRCDARGAVGLAAARQRQAGARQD